MLPDDHEYWNDYPFVDSWLPTLLALKLPRVRQIWRRAACDAVQNIQRSPVVESFTLGNDLTFCMADVRSHRSAHQFLPDGQFQKLLHWARSRSCPGILAIAQPLIVTASKLERNLRSFSCQYAQLLEALSAVDHDIVVFSGDVHFGRIASVGLGNTGTRLIEIVSSPLSNLTGLNGLATNVATAYPTTAGCPPKAPDAPAAAPGTPPPTAGSGSAPATEPPPTPKPMPAGPGGGGPESSLAATRPASADSPTTG